jgi:3-hydroxyacyl-CoA dehydrogenase/enoyl-CoA hydratase/3-hydroxybutyryl-CoA epimerase
MKYFKMKIDKRGIGTLVFDTPKSNANVFSNASMSELESQLNILKLNKELKALFIQSAKENIFISGADINEIKKAKKVEDIEAFIEKGQNLFNNLENMPFPVIAVVEGMCLGGGLELALACKYRIASSEEHTRLGFPEINLGILPGFGGTQRLYPLVGYAKAIELIVGAKQLKGEKALKLGVVDACVPEGYLEFKKEEFVKLILEDKLDEKIQAQRKGVAWYENISFVRKIINNITKKKIMEKTQGHYPAPLELLDVMQKSFAKPLKEGLEIERKAETKLILTSVSKNLIELFLISEKLKHDSFSRAKPKELHSAAVVGTGTMGSGIAWALNHQGMPVRLKVRSNASAAKAIQSIKKIYDGIVNRHRLTEREVALLIDKITFDSEYIGFEDTDFLLEAVSEDIKMKQEVYKAFEKIIPSDAVIASNTSSISISKLATTMQHPNRFIGMHFFNPVHRMPLVEIIAGEKSDDKTIAIVVKLAKKLGKVPIKIKDSSGFLVNRVLLPYIKESVLVFEEGADIEMIDQELVAFGMPMGPFSLLDTIGVDIGANVSDILYKSYGDRMQPSSIMQKMIANKWLGVKTKKGFYLYMTKHPVVNKQVYDFQKGVAAFNKQTVIDRTILIMINEAARCLEEGVVDNVQYLDMAMVMGTGFPAFRGGLMRYADTLGIINIVKNLERLRVSYGERFTPSKLLVDMAEKNSTFYGGA